MPSKRAEAPPNLLCEVSIDAPPFDVIAFGAIVCENVEFVVVVEYVAVVELNVLVVVTV